MVTVDKIIQLCNFFIIVVVVVVVIIAVAVVVVAVVVVVVVVIVVIVGVAVLKEAICIQSKIQIKDPVSSKARVESSVVHPLMKFKSHSNFLPRTPKNDYARITYFMLVPINS